MGGGGKGAWLRAAALACLLCVPPLPRFPGKRRARFGRSFLCVFMSLGGAGVAGGKGGAGAGGKSGGGWWRFLFGPPSAPSAPILRFPVDALACPHVSLV